MKNGAPRACAMQAGAPRFVVASLAALAILSGLAGCEPAAPDWQGPLGYRASEVFPLRLVRRGFPAVEARIDERPVRLVLDTGNMAGLLVAPALADRLGLPVTGRAVFSDADGRPVGMRRGFRVRSLRVFGSSWSGQPAWEAAGADPAALIGPRYLLGGRFTLDYRLRRLGVSASPASSGAGIGIALPLVWSSGNPGMLVVRGAVQDDSTLIQIDTGKSRTCVDPAFAARLGLERVAGGVRVRELSLARGISFFVPSAKLVAFSEISRDLPAPIGAAIGSDVLSNLLVTVDYPRRVIWIARR